MMKIDTTVLAGWEGRTVTLRFMHGFMDKGGNVQPYHTPFNVRSEAAPRATVAVIHEHRENLDGVAPEGWEKKNGEAGGYSRVVAVGVSRCSPKDRYAKETGRHFAVKRLLEIGSPDNPFDGITDFPALAVRAGEIIASTVEKTDLDTITGAAVNQYFENRSALARARR